MNAALRTRARTAACRIGAKYLGSSPSGYHHRGSTRHLYRCRQLSGADVVPAAAKRGIGDAWRAAIIKQFSKPTALYMMGVRWLFTPLASSSSRSARAARAVRRRARLGSAAKSGK
jgi:hypothetical protein